MRLDRRATCGLRGRSTHHVRERERDLDVQPRLLKAGVPGVRRVGLPDIPALADYTLEQLYYSDADRIADVIREMAKDNT